MMNQEKSLVPVGDRSVTRFSSRVARGLYRLRAVDWFSLEPVSECRALAVRQERRVRRWQGTAPANPIWTQERRARVPEPPLPPPRRCLPGGVSSGCLRCPA